MSRPTMIMRPSHENMDLGHQARVMAFSKKNLEDRRSHHEPACSSMLLLVSGTAISWLPSQDNVLHIKS